MRAWRTGWRESARYKSLCNRRATFSTSRVLGKGRSIVELLQQYGESSDVTVEGWVRSVRKQKNVAFAAISDGSTTDAVQAVLKPDDAKELTSGAAVSLRGQWKKSQGAKQVYELQVITAEGLGENDVESNPLQPKHQTPEYLRTIPHLRSRIPANALLLRLRSQLIASLTSFFSKEDFVQCHTPIITSSDCEGAGEVFTVASNNPDKSTVDRSTPPVTPQEPKDHFFRTPKYLTVSAQLHLEALAQAVNKVWTLSPTFRAEQSDTPRHLSEFYMLEAEMCFTQSLDDVMDLVEGMLRFAATELQDSRVSSELLKLKRNATKEEVEDKERFVSAETVRKRWDGLAAEKWPRITYCEAIDRLKAAVEAKEVRFAFAPQWQDGLQAEHERYIASTIGQGKPVFVTDYPRTQKPFYMSPSPDSLDTAACFDLLVPDLCELAGGSLREYNYAALLESMHAKGIGWAGDSGYGGSLDWYTDLRKYGSVPHGGFGLGFDRLVAYLAGVGSVRDVVAFPRWYGRCDC